MQETELYAPLKALFEKQGYTVKSEIEDCDLVAVRGDDPPVIVELKRSLSISLLLQGVDRQAVTDAVYVAFPAKSGPRWRAQLRDTIKLCRRLGLGLISVKLKAQGAVVEVHADPGPYTPRKQAKRKTALLREFSRRVGDPNTGGQTRRAIVTAYRQDALRIACCLLDNPGGAPAEISRVTKVTNAGTILSRNHYGWFQRIARGKYALTEAGEKALVHYRDIVAEIMATDAALAAE